MADKKADLAGPGIGDYAELEKILPQDYHASAKNGTHWRDQRNRLAKNTKGYVPQKKHPRHRMTRCPAIANLSTHSDYTTLIRGAGMSGLIFTPLKFVFQQFL